MSKRSRSNEDVNVLPVELIHIFKMSKRSRSEEDVDLPVELIHRIQSLLPSKEAGRTCILSKSWLDAWYTLPYLRLIPPDEHSTHENETKYNKLIHSTLQRYHRDNTPIQSFHLQLSILKPEDVRNWIRLVASKSTLRELSLDITAFLDDDYQSLALPNELFSSQGLHTIHVTAESAIEDVTELNRVGICSTNVINCVSLRVLDLECVFINQDVFYNLLSTCSLLEKIKLKWCGGLNNVKVNNLLHLTELDIESIEDDDLWEINNVPSLCSFRYSARYALSKPISFQIHSLASVTHLCIMGVIIDDSFFNTVGSKFSVLESLTLEINFWEHENMLITSASLKWLTLNLLQTGPVVNVQVYAPKLLSFIYTGIIPGLLFRTTAPEQVKLTLDSCDNLGHSYFLKMREALNLSSKFDINIRPDNLDLVVPLKDIDVDDLRRRVLFPVGNVELVLETDLDEHAWEQSRFFDAFFLICHPSYIRSSNQVIRKMMEGNTTDLKEVLLKNPHDGNWEALTSSSISVLDKFPGHLECKLNWFPQ